jgi:hypothetical protein
VGQQLAKPSAAKAEVFHLDGSCVWRTCNDRQDLERHQLQCKPMQPFKYCSCKGCQTDSAKGIPGSLPLELYQPQPKRFSLAQAGLVLLLLVCCRRCNRVLALWSS